MPQFVLPSALLIGFVATVFGSEAYLKHAEIRQHVGRGVDDDGGNKLGCFRSAHLRGAGSLPHVCPAESPDQSIGECYPACNDGYTGLGPLCVQQHCPNRFTDAGSACLKPNVYGRGVGYTQRSTCDQKHSQGCEKWGLLWYPRCRDGFGAFGCCVCTPACPEGMSELAGFSCAKMSYKRRPGDAPSCEPGKEEQGHLCYDSCEAGFSGFGPVCWTSSCPSSFPAPCGPICAVDAQTCNEIEAALGEQASGIALSGVAFAACAGATFTSPAAAIACWGQAISKVAHSSSTTAQYWTDGFVMCAAEGAAGPLAGPHAGR